MPTIEPQRDEEGNVKPHDHPEILDDDWLIRRVPQEWVVSDPKVPGGKRLSTRAFKTSSPELGGGMSVDIERLIEEAGIDVAAFVTTPRWTASLRITAGNLRGLQLQVGYSPVPENPYHGEAWGRITDGQSKALIRNSHWLVPMPDCSLAV